MQVAEILMLRYMSGAFRKDRITNDYIRGSLVVAKGQGKGTLAIVVWSRDKKDEEDLASVF